ncbi:MAG: DUF819 family protein [Bacteroidales bacterium]|nr:DUF819 family protein [Bacteroidales bacterium]
MLALETTFIFALCVLMPSLVLWLCRRFPWLDKLGPVMLLYVAGIVFGNLGLFKESLPAVQNLLTTAMIPVAIPLMLFGCSLKMSQARETLIAMILAIISVCTSVTIGFLVFGKGLEGGEDIGGLLVGVGTGGTINMAALKTMLGVPNETYILLNSCDMIVSFLYLAFLIAGGIKLCRLILPVKSFEEGAASHTEQGDVQPQAGRLRGLLTVEGLKDAGMQVGLAAVLIGVSALCALPFSKDLFMVVFILVLTTLSLCLSFVRKVREGRYGFDMGMYCIYVFSFVVASMADLSKLDIMGSLNVLAFFFTDVFGSLIILVLLARLFKVDSDTAVISSVACINSAPMVPMIATAMKNRKVLPAGLAVSIFGYAAGTYIGFLMSRFLTLL